MSTIETSHPGTGTTRAEREATLSRTRRVYAAKREARIAWEAEPHYIDMLELLPALAGRQASIIPLGPPSPLAEAYEVGDISPEVRESMGFTSRKTAIVREPVARVRGVLGAWDHLTRVKGIKFGLSASGRLALPGSNIDGPERQVIEALGPELIEDLLNAKGLGDCELDDCGDEAWSIVWPNRLRLALKHLDPRAASAA